MPQVGKVVPYRGTKPGKSASPNLPEYDQNCSPGLKLVVIGTSAVADRPDFDPVVIFQPLLKHCYRLSKAFDMLAQRLSDHYCMCPHRENLLGSLIEVARWNVTGTPTDTRRSSAVAWFLRGRADYRRSESLFERGAR